MPTKRKIPHYPRIYKCRKACGLSRESVATVLDVSFTEYFKIESGIKDVPTLMLKRLSLLFAVSIHYLLGMTDDPTPFPRAGEEED